MERLLTTTEAADRAGVGATAIKRWADQGLLPCVRTVGGHRRFEESVLLSFLREQQPVAEGARRDVDVWADALFAAEDMHEVEALLLQLRAREGAWYRAAMLVAPVLTAIGERFQRGEISIIEEHFASERLFRAIAGISDALPVSPSAEVALLATAEGDDHVLGLALAELCFREHGLRTFWSGRMTPVAELAGFVAGRQAQILAASASLVSTDQALLTRWVKKVAPVCEEHDVALLLGGSGAWPDPPRYGVRMRSFEELHAFLAGRSRSTR